MKKETKTSGKAPEVPEELIMRTALLNLAEDLHETKTELEKAKDYTDNIVQSMIDALLVVDPEGNIKTINKATSDLLGYTEDDLIGRPVATIFAEEEEEEEEEIPFKGTKMKKLIEGGAIRDYDMTYKTKSGEKIPVSFSGSVMRDKDGELVGIVGIAHDMRAIKRLMEKEKELAAATAATAAGRKRAAELDTAYGELERSRDAGLNIMERSERQRKELDKTYQELKNTKDELVQSEKLAAMSHFVTGSAHELNNPLAAVISFAETILGKLACAPADMGKLRESAEAVLRNAVRCESIVTSLMLYGRAQMSQSVPVDVNKLIEKSLSAGECSCSLKKINIQRHYSASLPLVMGSKEQLAQVFTNIIRNAVQAMHGCGVLGIDTKTEGNNVSIVFADSGEGIAPDELSSIFNPFYTTREPGQGTGLGLAVSSGIIRAHNGVISASSSGKGMGASFKVSLPIPTEDVKHV